MSISILFHVRGNGRFPGLNFQITDVEIESAVLKETPPCSPPPANFEYDQIKPIHIIIATKIPKHNCMHLHQTCKLDVCM